MPSVVSIECAVGSKSPLTSWRRRAAEAALCACPLGGAIAAAQSAALPYVVPLSVTIGTVGTAGSSGDNGPATSALLGNPVSFAYDAAGNLYILDKSKNAVRKVNAVTNVITTVAGVEGAANAFAGDGGSATSAKLNGPNQIAVDTAGNIYIADTGNNRVRKVTVATGIITTIAGDGSTAFAGDGLAANGSQGAVGLSGVNAVAVDVNGNVFVGDSGHERVREVYAATGIINTIAGNGVSSDTGNGGPASAATLSGPRYLAFDSRGDLVMTDRTLNNVRYIAPNGNVYALAGNQTLGYTGDGGPGPSAELNVPNGAVADAWGNVYIMDTGNTAVRVVDAQSGNIYTLPFTLTGTGASTPLSGPLAFAVSPNGTFVIADSTNHVVRSGSLPNLFGSTPVGSASPSATFTLTDGNAVDTVSSWGLNHATPADFTFGSVSGCTFGTALALYGTCMAPVTFSPTAPGLRASQLLATDPQGNLSYLALTGVGTAAAVAVSPGTIAAIAGTHAPGTGGDGGAALSAAITGPAAVALDSANNIYLTGADNTVRMVNATSGTISRIAGTGTSGYTGDGAAATAATLSNPSGLAVDPTGNVFIADTGNSVVRMVGVEAGVIRSVTPVGLLNGPKGIATDALGNLYIADTNNNVVREVIAKTSVIATLAGIGTASYTGDGGAATAAQLDAPAGIAVDASGNVYIADTGNNVIRKVTAAGTISTIAGTGAAGNSGDGGLATAATLNGPAEIAVDTAGDLYVACIGSHSVRMISAAGLITTVAGTGTTGYSGNGGLANAAALASPSGVAVDQLGNIYVGDTGNNVVRKVVQTATSLSFAATNPGQTTAPQLVTVTNFGNQALTLTGLTVPAGFIQKASGGVDCTSTTTLVAGGQCLLSLAFSPTGSGPFNGNVTLTDNALGRTAATQSIAVSGTGNVTSLPTTIAATAGNNQTTAPYSAFATALQVTVLDQNGFGSSGVSVVFTASSSGATGTFSNGTNTITVVTAAGGVANVPFTAAGTRGTFAVTAKATGITTPATFNETIAGNPAPTISVTISPATSPIVYGTAVTLSAALAGPANSPIPVTGTVTFLDGSTPVGSGAVTNGVASAPPFVPAAGSHSFTASYGSDPDYMAATSGNTISLTVTPLAITATATAISVPFGTAVASVPAVTGAAVQGVLAKDTGNVTPVFTDPYLQTTGIGFTLFGVTLTGSAAANYTVTTTSGITVTQAPTALSLASSLTTAGPATTVTLTATLTSAVTGGVLAGASVSFYDGATLLGARTTGTAGVATYAGTFALGTHVITATYATTANYLTVTSSSVTLVVQNPDVPITLGLTSITVKQGQVAVVPMTFNTVGGLASTVTFACSGLPANAACTFTPSTFTPVLSGTVVTGGSGIVSVTTAGAGVTASLQTGRPTMLFTGLIGCVLASLTLRRRRLASIFVLLIMASAVSGCGTTANSLSPIHTPVGTSTIVVTASSGTVSESASFTLVVTPAAEP